MFPTTRLYRNVATPRCRAVRAVAGLALSALSAACAGDGSEPRRPAQVVVTATATTLTALGATTQLSAVVLDRRGAPMQGVAVTWSSGNPAVVQVSAAGLATAVGPGTAVITAAAPPATGTIELTVQQVPTGLDLVGGAGQEGEVGTALPEPVKFRVTDSGGNPIAGSLVSFVVTRGGGSVAATPVATGPDGVAQTIWTLGTDASQPQELTAVVGPLSRSVSAGVRPGPPASVEPARGNGQTGLAGEPLPDSLGAIVADRFRNPVRGASVSWIVEIGGGTIRPPQSTTDPGGMARAQWILGGGVGANQARAEAIGATPAIFQATALPNGVIQGTVTLSSSLLARPAAELVAAAGTGGLAGAKASGVARGALQDVDPSWLPGQAARLPGSRRSPAVDTLRGTWVVKLRGDFGAPRELARFTTATAAAVAQAIRAQLASVPGVQDGRLSIAGVSPVLGVARLQIRAGEDETAILAALRRDPRVEWVEPVMLIGSMPDRLAKAGGGMAVPLAALAGPPLVDERYFPRQSWHYGLIGLPRGWEITEGDPSVMVAVVDDGIRFDHPSVAPNLTADGYDFVTDIPQPHCSGGFVSSAGDGGGPDPDPTIPVVYSRHRSLPCFTGPDAFGGHGLHVAGTIAAAAASGGLVGVAPRVRIRPVRVLGTTGSGSTYDIAQGILYAAGLPADNGAGGTVAPASRAPIINLSLGSPANSAVLAEAVGRAAAAGSLLIAAAGNDGTFTPFYPAAYPEVISVSAVGPAATITSYSNRGSTVDIAAPGGDLSLGPRAGVWSSYWSFQAGSPTLFGLEGTSMAAPHVSGVAALLLSRSPGLSAGQLRDRLLSTAVALGDPALYGRGLVDAVLALTNGQGFPSSLHAYLVNAETGARVRQMPTALDRSFRFSGLSDGSYFVYAGLDDRGDGVTGRPGFLWGARGGASTPAPIAIQGHGVRDGSLTIGFPAEREPNDSDSAPNLLLVGGYAYGTISPATDVDVYRIRIPQAGSYTFETGGWYGMCGWGLEVDTVLELFNAFGGVIASNDDIDAARDRFCSRITVTLEPGTYTLRVRGFGIGLYTVRAS